jgi:anti-sigma B factor antagonist
MSMQDADTPGASVVVDFPTPSRDATGPAVSVRHHRSGRWMVVEVTGEMDLQVFSLMPRLPRKRTAGVVFELGGVTFMDAGGLALLSGTQRRAFAVGGEVRLAAPSRAALRLLELTGSAGVFPIFDSVDAALAPV